MQKKTDDEIIERAMELFPEKSRGDVVKAMNNHHISKNGSTITTSKDGCCGNCSGNCASHA